MGMMWLIGRRRMIHVQKSDIYKIQKKVSFFPFSYWRTVYKTRDYDKASRAYATGVINTS